MKKKDTIAIVTNKKQHFSEVARTLETAYGWTIRWVDSAEKATELAEKSPPELMVIDEPVDGLSNIRIARDIVMANPMLNLALVSALPTEIFHQATEGLGVAAQLPPWPKKEDALRLMETIEKICL
ncbi:MAG: hypothetical protein JRI36_01110 [Deltaproteobacteria bacterium]|nr:hypothetical protein [Deltaproteobacteria bacterium]